VAVLIVLFMILHSAHALRDCHSAIISVKSVQSVATLFLFLLF